MNGDGIWQSAGPTSEFLGEDAEGNRAEGESYGMSWWIEWITMEN
jgi:hypothetical protein